jgi:hypothetical protein
VISESSEVDESDVLALRKAFVCSGTVSIQHLINMIVPIRPIMACGEYVSHENAVTWYVASLRA